MAAEAGINAPSVAGSGASRDMSMKTVITLIIVSAAVTTKAAVGIITLPDNIFKSIQHSIHATLTTYLSANPK